MRDKPPRHQGCDDRGAEDYPKSGTGEVTFLTSELRHDHLKAALQIRDV
jgi:hypothetical protein